jgi:hypothetical protein
MNYATSRLVLLHLMVLIFVTDLKSQRICSAKKVLVLQRQGFHQLMASGSWTDSIRFPKIAIGLLIHPTSSANLT